MPFAVKDFFIRNRIKAFLFLIRELGFSQREAQRYIARGRLFVGGEAMRDPAGEIEGEVQCVVFEPVSRGLKPIFETAEFALYDKPSGVLVHPQNRRTPYSMVDEIRFRFGPDANIVHRIDQETSGLLLAATNKKAERRLKMMFENRDVTKGYLAFVRGKMTGESWIEAPLLRREDDSAVVRMVVRVHSEGKPSRTFVRALEYYPSLDVTLVEAWPHTGRQHQIRVHLFHVKHPIVGDPIYAQSEAQVLRFLDREISPKERVDCTGSNRLLLHAATLRFKFDGIDYFLKSRCDFVKEGLDRLVTVSRET